MKNNNNDWLSELIDSFAPTDSMDPTMIDPQWDGEAIDQAIKSAIKERFPKEKKRAVGYPVNEGLEIYKEGYNTAIRDTLKALGIEN